MIDEIMPSGWRSRPTVRLLVGLCIPTLLAAAIVAEILAAQTPPVSDVPPQIRGVADQEPITPIPPPPPVDPRKRALGERLFNDVRLSAKGDFACSTCHDLRTNGAGGRSTRKGPAGDSSGNGNPPLDTLSVFNASLSFRL